VLRNPGLRSEAPPPLLVRTLFTLGVATRVYVPPRNYERPGGVEWVKADWGTESRATRVSWAGSMPPEPIGLRSEATTCSCLNDVRN